MWFEKIINLDHVIEIRWELGMMVHSIDGTFRENNIERATLVLSNGHERTLDRDMARKLFVFIS